MTLTRTKVSPSPSAFDYGEDIGIDMMDLAMDVEEFSEGLVNL